MRVLEEEGADSGDEDGVAGVEGVCGSFFMVMSWICSQNYL